MDTEVLAPAKSSVGDAGRSSPTSPVQDEDIPDMDDLVDDSMAIEDPVSLNTPSYA